MFNQVYFDIVACEAYNRAIIASSRIVFIRDGEVKLCPEYKG